MKLLYNLQCIKALKSSGRHMDFQFLKYDQSSKCKNFEDSSVSYAAGSLIIDWFNKKTYCLVDLIWLPNHILPI